MTTPIHSWDLHAEVSAGALLSCIILSRFQFGTTMSDISQRPFKICRLIFQLVQFIFLRNVSWKRGIGRYSM